MAPSADLLREPKAAWSPWRPTDSDPWDEGKAAHLHRRAGLGATWSQVRRDVAEGFEPTVRRVLDGESHGPDGRPADEFAEIVQAMIASARREPDIERVRYLWLFRLIFTPHALAERMTLAWHSHYATSYDKVRDPLPMLDQNLALRELWRSTIAQLHLRMLRDPAMMIWLDGLGSRKSRPNENFAREFLEIFALGEGNYTETDIRAVARALTGWVGQPDRPGQIRFDADEHDAGDKTLFGQTGSWGTEDVVRIVGAQPAAAVHIARRLFRTLVADAIEPPAGLLESLAAAMRKDGDVDLARGIELILHSRLFYSTLCRGKRVKGPVELVVGAIRACERFDPPPDMVELDGWLTRMGQRLFHPPNVAGWPDGLSWLRGPTLLARAGFAAAGTTSDEASAERVARKYGLERPHDWAKALVTLIVGTPQAPDTRGAAPSFGAIASDVLARPEAQLA
jgi:uncharacterized protein (DUF1800 family)